LTTATFTPNCPLKEGTVYVGTIMANGIAVQTAPRTWQFTTIAESPDTDHDGVPDNEDDFPRNRGKATPPNPKGHGKYLVEVDADSGIYLSAMTAVSDTSARLNQAGRLAGYEFKDGVISYRIEGVPVGATVTLDIVSPSGVPKGSKVYKVDETGFHEYSSAVINGNTVTLTLTDGGSGDSDGLANGVIVDPVGIASPAASGSGSIDLSTNAAGGGCSISGTDDRNAAVSLGMLILLGAALIGARAVAKRAARL
ncbi:MAG: choice-of-anchor U domain-containing protein, partial [Deltaproteobacteria bacterium]